MKKKKESRAEQYGIAPKHMHKAVEKLVPENACCPKCFERRLSKITQLRTGFRQCETCKEYFVSTENLHRRRKVNG